MVNAGSAVIASQNGKVRSIRLTQTASSHAERTGEATPGQNFGVRFTRWRKLDCGASILEFHPRSFW
jgi:hypothetical protein